MTPEAQRVAIAKVCPAVAMIDGAGVPVWRDRHEYAESSSKLQRMEFEPLEDLNAMHEAVRSQLPGPDFSWTKYCERLVKKHGRYGAIDATAAQRCEAFLKTLNLWTP